MPKQPSIATQLQSATDELSRLYKGRSDMLTELQVALGRANKAEKECAEWKERFDILLRSKGQS